MEKHYFVALDVPNPSSQLIYHWVCQNKWQWSFASYVHPSDYHLTLAFLGSAEKSTLAKLSTVLKKVCEQHGSFTLQLAEVGTFGRSGFPRILWIGIKENHELKRLRDSVYEVCKQLKFSLDERPFKPHITVARKWKADSPFSIHKTDNAVFHNESISVRSVTLFQTNFKQIPKYEAIQQYSLH